MAMTLSFLRGVNTTRKTIRTMLYGDTKFTLFEMEILHTPIFQRLYNLKQLGMSDRVFPDAVHSRFNHALGVTHISEVMALNVIKWLEEKQPDTLFKHHDSDDPLTGNEVAFHIKELLQPVRLMGLLHDLTHAAYGHTLEDEACVFEEKHDDPRRQILFFDTLTAQLVFTWCSELGLIDPSANDLIHLSYMDFDEKNIIANAEALRESISKDERTELNSCLKQLKYAFVALTHLEFMHKSITEDDESQTAPENPSLLINKILWDITGNEIPEFVLHRDAFLLDIVGNTVCSDLIDYARRDSKMSALKMNFDDRFIRYLVLTSVKGKLSPTRKQCLRLAIQFYTDKMRHDVLSELSVLLNSRYLISERILFHPTKCAADAMLGTAVQLLGLKSLRKELMIYGDQEFIQLLNRIARKINSLITYIVNDTKATEIDIEYIQNSPLAIDEFISGIVLNCVRVKIGGDVTRANLISKQNQINEHLETARKILWRFSSRRFPKTVYRLRSEVYHSGSYRAKNIAVKFNNPNERFKMERNIEEHCDLPLGSIFIHCLPWQPGMKIAKALVVGSEINKASYLRDLTDVRKEGLEPYQEAIRAIEKMYRSIWRLHVFLDASYMDRKALVIQTIEHKNNVGFPNDALLDVLEDEEKTPFDYITNDFKDDIPFNLFPEIAHALENEVRLKAQKGYDIKDIVRDVLDEVIAKKYLDSAHPIIDNFEAAI